MIISVLFAKLCSSQGKGLRTNSLKTLKTFYFFRFCKETNYFFQKLFKKKSQPKVRRNSKAKINSVAKNGADNTNVMSWPVVFEAVFHYDNVCPLLWYLSTDGILNSPIPSVLNRIDPDAVRLDMLPNSQMSLFQLDSREMQKQVD